MYIVHKNIAPEIWNNSSTHIQNESTKNIFEFS